MWIRPKLEMLSEDSIKRIIGEARLLLKRKGVYINHPSLLKRIDYAGCAVDHDSKRAWLDGDIIYRCLSSAPSSVSLWNVSGTKKWRLCDDNFHFTPGSAAIKVLDQKDNVRTATLDDMISYSKVIGQLSNLDYPSTAVVPGDVSEEVSDSIRLYALLLALDKPVVTGAFTLPGFKVMSDLLLAVRGSKYALRTKPLAMFSCCPSSPLKWSHETADNTMKCAELGIPVEFISMPLPGMISPITLVGSLVQHTAETISGIVISQLSSPGSPVLYGGSPGGFDMRHSTATIGSVEAQMMDCAYAQIGKYLGLPTQAYIGLSDSKRLDAQAGHETSTGLYMGALAGINSISGPGMLCYESCQSLEKLVLDNELCAMARRLVSGIGCLDELGSELMEPVFDELIERHELLSSEHTMKHFRSEHRIPGTVIDRTPMREGQIKELPERANEQVGKLLSGYKPSTGLDKDRLKDVREVMGKAVGEPLLKYVTSSLS